MMKKERCKLLFIVGNYGHNDWETWIIISQRDVECWKVEIHFMYYSHSICSLSISHLHVVTRSDQTLTRILSGKISLTINMTVCKTHVLLLKIFHQNWLLMSLIFISIQYENDTYKKIVNDTLLWYSQVYSSDEGIIGIDYICVEDTMFSGFRAQEGKKRAPWFPRYSYVLRAAKKIIRKL